MQLYGILGGTFDPIHNGHLHAAQQLINSLHLDQLRVLPSYQSSLRSTSIASAADRLAMVKLAIADYPYMVADDREITRQGISYTFDTLQSLRQEFPQAALAIIIGADAFQTFDRWHRWQEIPMLAHIIIANRPDYILSPSRELDHLIQTRHTSCHHELRDTPAGKVLFTDIKPLPISATQIRHLLATNKDVKNYLPQKVYEYINEHGLYRKSNL